MSEPRRVEYVELGSLTPAVENPKGHDVESLRQSIERFGLVEVAAVVDERTQRVVSGHGRLVELARAHAAELPPPDGVLVDADSGEWRVPVLRGWASADDAEAEAALVAVNETVIAGGWQQQQLSEMLQRVAESRRGLTGTGYDDGRLASLLARVRGPQDRTEPRDPDAPTLADRFVVPPFTVLDARQGYWLERKRRWLDLGIESELGRSDELLTPGPAAAMQQRTQQRRTGDLVGPYDGGDTWGTRATSVFDPVLCELVYRWHSPPDGRVLDPFAGGSVRGVTAAMLGRQYVGVELRAEQIAANVAQLDTISSARDVDGSARWLQGDSSTQLDELVGDEPPFDLLFSCPPYYDLEVYSDDERDLSNADSWETFCELYRATIAAAVARLAEDRFAVFVVGELRDKRTAALRGLVAETVDAFEAAGAAYWNDAILVSPVGSLALRAGTRSPPNRKLGRAHQYVLTFCKGDPRRAADACGSIDVEPALQLFGAAPSSLDDELSLGEPVELIADPHELTPVERRGDVWVKRDDLFGVGSSRGGKVRSALALAQQPGVQGLITAGGRQSPQVNIVAEVGQLLGLPVRCHVPSGAYTPELVEAESHGAELIQHNYGRQSVIGARARQDAEARDGWLEVPFGMECQEAVDWTAAQVQNLPDGVARIVVPVGSSMSLAGIVTGLERYDVPLPVLAVSVVAIPTLERRMDKWAPPDWRDRVEVVKSEVDYHVPAPQQMLHGLRLDPIYESKCLPYLQPDDLLWVVGLRGSLHVSAS